MAEAFELAVYYKDQPLEFPAELRLFGHTHKIAVTVNSIEVIFEPDEERNYRALISEADLHKSRIDVALLAAIAAELEAAFK